LLVDSFNVLAYADEMVLLAVAPSWFALQKLTNLLPDVAADIDVM